jgi:D-alanyl-lipoteichoic acid acyltransferase DltB (MBOAT superfamily)
MLPSLGPVTVDSVTFVALSGALVILAWSRANRFFLPALTAAGVLMALSWLGWKDLAALVIFLSIPYLAAKVLWGRKERPATLTISGVVVWQLLLFLVIKRYSWFDFLGWVDQPVVVIGISYILFRQLHLVIDARFLGNLPFSFLRYIGFLLSPWTLVAGPIQRYEEFCWGLDGIGRPPNQELLEAGHRIVNGLILAFVIAPIFLEPSRITNLGHPEAGFVDLAIVFYGFPFYLYMNFAGYTGIMIGFAKLCGFSNLPENFMQPYLAVNTRDFWTRWHISFGLWIKHYVFTPACAYLFAVANPKWHKFMMLVAVLLAFYVVGVWHGTTVNYLIFGILQGTGVIVSAAFEQWRKRVWGGKRTREINKLYWFRALSIVVTLHFTCFSFLLLNDHPDRLIEAVRAYFV